MNAREAAAVVLSKIYDSFPGRPSEAAAVLQMLTTTLDLAAELAVDARLAGVPPEDLLRAVAYELRKPQ